MEPYERALAYVRGLVDGPPVGDFDVTVHFHPDRPVGELLLLRHLVEDGVYRSQFETGTSNGGLTAHPGGDRWQWEHRMFAGAYDDAPPSHRPLYGALNVRRYPVGGAVRFGSAHLRLRPAVLARTTFCYPDSVLEPTDFGTAEHLPLVALAEADGADGADVLDDYIEAHVHGGLSLSDDVEAVVLDPSYRTTDVEDAAGELPCAVEWHAGFRLPVDELARHGDYRGEDVVAAGTALAEDGWLDPRIIGDAARAGRFDPQTVKRVWHCTARFGYAWPEA
ncbi:DUF3626 domain-containing protein [Cryptosporangium phraense]|uniref:DUF3626 domain-containing protein n=1 Tax=Cryptosporangium phraense TaxID=2593070 RepID=UPI00197B027A|nr:DUF3626 domain-containing protein [Cryptosporangium phraense]